MSKIRRCMSKIWGMYEQNVKDVSVKCEDV